MQEDEPAIEYQPEEHGVQEALDEPPDGLDDPAAHENADVAAHMPADCEPALDVWPLGHAEQEIAPATEYEPAGQMLPALNFVGHA